MTLAQQLGIAPHAYACPRLPTASHIMPGEDPRDARSWVDTPYPHALESSHDTDAYAMGRGLAPAA